LTGRLPHFAFSSLRGRPDFFYFLPFEERLPQPGLLPLNGRIFSSCLLPLEGGGLRWG